MSYLVFSYHVYIERLFRLWYNLHYNILFLSTFMIPYIDRPCAREVYK